MKVTGAKVEQAYAPGITFTGEFPVCTACGGEGHGLQWHHALSRQTFHACCWAHLDLIGQLLAQHGAGGLAVAISDVEIMAIKRSKHQFADALEKIGKLDSFADCTVDQIESVIAATWRACRSHMDAISQRVGPPLDLADDEIPF